MSLRIRPGSLIGQMNWDIASSQRHLRFNDNHPQQSICEVKLRFLTGQYVDDNQPLLIESPLCAQEYLDESIDFFESVVFILRPVIHMPVTCTKVWDSFCGIVTFTDALLVNTRTCYGILACKLCAYSCTSCWHEYYILRPLHRSYCPVTELVVVHDGSTTEWDSVLRVAMTRSQVLTKIIMDSDRVRSRRIIHTLSVPTARGEWGERCRLTRSRKKKGESVVSVNKLFIYTFVEPVIPGILDISSLAPYYLEKWGHDGSSDSSRSVRSRKECQTLTV